MLAFVPIALFSSCAHAAQAHLSDAIAGTVRPDQFIETTVTDTRIGPPSLVELSDGHDSIWVKRFSSPPERGAKVWTAILGAPDTDPQLGLVYPSAGALHAPDVGLTEEGTLAIVIAIALGVAVLLPLVVRAVTGVRGGRRCPGCRRAIDAGWRTCPSCGTAIESQVTSPNATFISSAPAASDPVPKAEPTASPEQAPAEPQPSGGQPTRIVRRE